MARRLQRLLRRMADDRRRTLEAAATLREEHRHRLLPEPADAKLERELGNTRLSSPRWSCCAAADAGGVGGGAPDAADGRGLRRRGEERRRIREARVAPARNSERRGGGRLPRGTASRAATERKESQAGLIWAVGREQDPCEIGVGWTDGWIGIEQLRCVCVTPSLSHGADDI